MGLPSTERPLLDFLTLYSFAAGWVGALEVRQKIVAQMMWRLQYGLAHLLTSNLSISPRVTCVHSCLNDNLSSALGMLQELDQLGLVFATQAPQFVRHEFGWFGEKPSITGQLQANACSPKVANDGLGDH